MVSSAAEMMFEVGAFTTMTPAVVAALMSTLSSPTPARATTCSFGRGGDRLGVDLASRSGPGPRPHPRARPAAPGGRCRRRSGSRSRARGRRRWRARVLRRSGRPALPRGSSFGVGAGLGGERHDHRGAISSHSTGWRRVPFAALRPAQRADWTMTAFESVQLVVRIALAAVFVFMGVLHFRPGGPADHGEDDPAAGCAGPGCSARRCSSRFTGLCEIAGGVGLLLPPTRVRGRDPAGRLPRRGLPGERVRGARTRSASARSRSPLVPRLAAVAASAARSRLDAWCRGASEDGCRAADAQRMQARGGDRGAHDGRAIGQVVATRRPRPGPLGAPSATVARADRCTASTPVAAMSRGCRARSLPRRPSPGCGRPPRRVERGERSRRRRCCAAPPPEVRMRAHAERRRARRGRRAGRATMSIARWKVTSSAPAAATNRPSTRSASTAPISVERTDDDTAMRPPRGRRGCRRPCSSSSSARVDEAAGARAHEDVHEAVASALRRPRRRPPRSARPTGVSPPTPSAEHSSMRSASASRAMRTPAGSCTAISTASRRGHRFSSRGRAPTSQPCDAEGAAALRAGGAASATSQASAAGARSARDLAVDVVVVVRRVPREQLAQLAAGRLDRVLPRPSRAARGTRGLRHPGRR